jgi:hypothetical protein
VIGGKSSGSAISNTVGISTGNITGDVIGGWSLSTGTASGNTVTISNGAIKGDVFGGKSETEGATENKVERK